MASDFFIPPLNHSSGIGATIVPEGGDTLRTMVEISDYGSRFAQAMKLAGSNEHAIAKALNVSYQAIKKVLDGKTKALAAENSVRAAWFLKVDPDWLATGEGQPQGATVWPFSPEVLAAVRELRGDDLRRAENALRAHLDLPTLAADTANAKAA